jgi:hypothetical protein
MLAGLGAWGVFLATCRKLAATGLEAPRRNGPRLLWGGTGALLGIALGHLIAQQTGWHHAAYDIPGVTFGLALWIGEKLHQIPTGGELDRPISLFGGKGFGGKS